MSLPDTEAVKLERETAVLRVTFNRPAAGNALNEALVTDLEAIFTAIADDRTVRAVVLRGAGKHFCVGGDINEMGPMIRGAAQDEGAAAAEHSRRFGRLMAAIDGAPQAVVAVVEGSALGGGFGLACAADITLALRTARFGMPEARRGLVAAQIAPFVIARMGVAEARRLAVAGHMLDAEGAHRVGVVHELLADSAAVETRLAEELAAINQCAPGAIAATKAIFAQAARRAPAELLDAAARCFVDALRSSEGMEGVRAFAEKRAPAWSQSEA